MKCDSLWPGAALFGQSGFFLPCFTGCREPLHLKASPIDNMHVPPRTRDAPGSVGTGSSLAPPRTDSTAMPTSQVRHFLCRNPNRGTTMVYCFPAAPPSEAPSIKGATQGLTPTPLSRNSLSSVSFSSAQGTVTSRLPLVLWSECWGLPTESLH